MTSTFVNMEGLFVTLVMSLIVYDAISSAPYNLPEWTGGEENIRYRQSKGSMIFGEDWHDRKINTAGVVAAIKV